ncbi:Gamma-aminobutyric acid type B receptor subunit 1 [Eumeta japonica]|uniref:Gamma-aminobutyric acid type B receptor subunit 1 n=1 Tax=Eumeta variegata TaxID=151549 RepID=A0A4C1XGJ9_EUMVA|nr:Gamma-aminobutyric acid type B receptor subunit 1 [Eumeta japonica]
MAAESYSRPFLQITKNNSLFITPTSHREGSGWYEDNWFETNLEKENIECTKEQMREAAEGHLTTEALMWNQNANQTTISGMTSEDFRSGLYGGGINTSQPNSLNLADWLNMCMIRRYHGEKHTLSADLFRMFLLYFLLKSHQMLTLEIRIDSSARL